MHEAARTGNLAQLNLVIEFAPHRIDKNNRYRETPLHCAAEHDQEAAVSLLLSAKADVNNSSGGWTPLHLAAEHDQEAAVRLLLSAKADVNKTDSYGQTPLDYAQGDRVKQLLIDAERQQRALDAEINPLNMNGPDGKFTHDARLNGTLQELTEKVVLKFGLTKEYAKDVEMHLSGYKLEPVTKIVREFTELCAVILGWCKFEGVTNCLIAGLGD